MHISGPYSCPENASETPQEQYDREAIDSLRDERREQCERFLPATTESEN